MENQQQDPNSGVFVTGLDKNGMVKIELNFGSHRVNAAFDKDFVKAALEYVASLNEDEKADASKTKCGYGYLRTIPGGAPRLPSPRPASKAPQQKYAAKSSSAPRTSKPVSTDW